MGNVGRFIAVVFILRLAEFFNPSGIEAQKIRVGLFDDQAVNACVIHCTEGSYKLFGDSLYICDVKIGELIYLSLNNDVIRLMKSGTGNAQFSTLKFSENGQKSSFRLKVVDPAKDPQGYSGDLEITCFHGAMQLVNETQLDDYLAGVVEAEGGPAAKSEFYKAQAVLCRSYAIKNWERHPGQDFNLCDNTHCQVFHGISDENPAIPDAVLATHGLVLVDQNFNIVPAIFHSNSGGETQRATDVWGTGDEYLQSVLDPFSEGLRNSNWEKQISMETWRQYLANHSTADLNKFPNEDILIKQPHRKKYFILGKDSLRLADIRTDLGLKSSFFSMEARSDTILIRGKGYGHGVGMSQEGAMEMARQGYSFSDILRFYFYNVQVVELDDVPLSGLPEDFR